MLDARAVNQFSEPKLIAFDKENEKKPPPPPPHRTEKCPPRGDDGHGGDGRGGDGNNGGHDCRGNKGGGE
jgi:hypothetical protein